jgi:transcriptional regulator GlxA family with amidase domain
MTMPAAPRPAVPLRPIHVLAFPGAQLLDVTGPLQVFASANECSAARGGARPYVPRVIAAEAGLVTTSAGVAVHAHGLRTGARAADTLIVAGGQGVHAAARNRALVAWIGRQAGRVRRLASVCSGAFLLAEAGVLDGRRAVTHWAHCTALAQRYPRVSVDVDPIFVRDGDVWTSAGVTAGIDLALALVEEDLGRALALDVARELVVFLKRPGGQAQFSALLSVQQAAERFGALHAWIADNLRADLAVPVLAARAQMSERSFVRHYRAETGRTPARMVEQFRVEAAQRLLDETAWPLKRIAARCGFGGEDTMRRSFVRVLDVTPQVYRQRFAR